MSNRHRLLSASAFVALLSGAIGVSTLHPQTAPTSQDSFAKIQPLLSKYCYKCHGPGAKPKADLNLANFSSEAAIRGNRKVWKEVLNKTLTKEMPPDDAQPRRPGGGATRSPSSSGGVTGSTQRAEGRRTVVARRSTAMSTGTPSGPAGRGLQSIGDFRPTTSATASTTSATSSRCPRSSSRSTSPRREDRRSGGDGEGEGQAHLRHAARGRRPTPRAPSEDARDFAEVLAAGLPRVPPASAERRDQRLSSCSTSARTESGDREGDEARSAAR